MRLCEQVGNRWHAILPALGIAESFLRNKHGPCPMCGGKDRWRFDNKEGTGTWFCSNCGAGDGVKLVMIHRGVDFAEAAILIKRLAGLCEEAPKRRIPSHQGDGGALLWKSALPIRAEDPAGKYLCRRCDLARIPGDLRFAETVKYSGGERPQWFPALLALVRDVSGSPVNVARTYLTEDGEKAPVETVRKLCAGSFPLGAAVRLWRPIDGALVVAEGIETALSAAKIFKRPAWAMLTAGNLARLDIIADVTDLIIAGDCDDSFTGQAAAYVAARRIKARSKGAITVRVEIPGHRNDQCDWNDVGAGIAS